MIVLSHPTSNEFNRAAAHSLRDANLLSEFHTSIASFPETLLDSLGKFGPFSEIHRRRFDPNLFPITYTNPWKEIGRHLSSKLKFNKLICDENSIFSVDSVYKSLDKKVASVLPNLANNGVSGIYAYEDCAYYSFKEAKRLGLQTFYDLPIGYWQAARKYLMPERDKWPEWSSTMAGFKDSEMKLARKDKELSLSSRIFVASGFTANTLKDFPGTLAPVEIIPYGFPPVTCERVYNPSLKDKPLKLLFVGGLSQRKGIAHLFEAVKKLGNNVSLTIVGQKAVQDCKVLNASLSKHTWIPSLPHHEILKLMRKHDALLFPSLFEGFGLVISEAMSQGTPVITTDRTAGPDFIIQGENGWLVEAGSTQSLQKCVESILHEPDQLAKVGQAAMNTAKKRPWEVYGRELNQAILNHR